MKSYTSEFKAKAVLEVLRETRSISEIASDKGLHPNLLGRWKNEAVQGLPTIFDMGRKKAKEAKAQNEAIQDLYTQIGELTTKLNWLKKKSGIDI